MTFAMPGSSPFGGEHRESRQESPYLQPALELKRHLLLIKFGNWDKAGAAKEVRKLLASVHPDIHPGDKTMEQLAKIAAQILDILKGDRMVSVRQYDDLDQQLGDLIRGAQAPAPAPMPPAPAPAAPRASAWEDLDEDEAADEEAEPESERREAPPYEIADFDFGRHLVGKRISRVQISLTEDEMGLLFNQDRGGYSDYGGQMPMEFFQVEGVDGVVVPMKSSTDDYRDNFGGWMVIKAIPARVVEDLGTITRLDAYNEISEGSLDGYDKGTEVRTSNGKIRFGTNAYDAYYPHAYCSVETAGGRRRY